MVLEAAFWRVVSIEMSQIHLRNPPYDGECRRAYIVEAYALELRGRRLLGVFCVAIALLLSFGSVAHVARVEENFVLTFDVENAQPGWAFDVDVRAVAANSVRVKGKKKMCRSRSGCGHKTTADRSGQRADHVYCTSLGEVSGNRQLWELDDKTALPGMKFSLAIPLAVLVDFCTNLEIV